MRRIRSASVALALVVGLGVAGSAEAHEDATHAEGEEAEETSERVEAVEQSVQILAEEIDALRKIFAVPEGGLESYSGLGPAASKVYQRDRGLSIGGYGEVRFRGEVADKADDGKNIFDALRMVLYTGYKFNDWIVFNSELEFEHAGSGGGGSVSTEFLTLDFLLCECANVRAGLLLVPMGFVNEIHEPTFFFGNERPEVERRIIPSTWRENGVGLYGSFLDDRVQYRIYGMNGFDGAGFSDDGFRGGRQKGSEALADHFAVVGRVDVEPVDGLLLGGSVYYGNSGQNQSVTPVAGPPAVPGGNLPDAATTIWEIHGQLQRFGAHVRGLYSESVLEDSASMSAVLGDTIAKRMNGGYVEFAYDLLPLFNAEIEMSFEPFYRYERLNTQRNVTAGSIAVAGPANASRDRRYHVVGVSYKPHPQVVIKVDYRNIDSAGSDLPDEVQVGFGFVF